jgi:hypothetical protein
MDSWPFRGNRGDAQLTITNSTAVTTLLPAFGAGVFADLYAIVISNTSGSVCEVTLRDSDDTNSVRASIEVPANDTRGFVLRAEDAMQQRVSNKIWTVQCGSSVSSIKITALFKKNS